jgi:hypothetical protein
MSRIIDGPSVEPVARGLLGAIDIGDGGTSEQRNVLAAIVSSYWGRPDLTLETLEPMGPEEFASTIAEHAARRRFREFMVMLELCRHPLDDAQVALVDSYAAAMGVAGPGLDLARVLLREGSARAYADLVRFREVSEPAWAEPSLVERYMTRNAEPDAADLELAARLRSLQGLPEGTLGREYVEFYRRQGVTLPGDDPAIPAFFVGHDMNHVIAGYGTTGQAETALSAMLLGMTDSDDHWVLLLTSLGAYEVALSGSSTFIGKEGVLDREGAATMIAEAFHRGSQCSGDFSVADHLSMVELPLDEVRARFGVPPLVGQRE